MSVSLTTDEFGRIIARVMLPIVDVNGNVVVRDGDMFTVGPDGNIGPYVDPQRTPYGESMIQVTVVLPNGAAVHAHINAHVLEGVPVGDVLGGYGDRCASEIGKIIATAYRQAQSA